MHMHMHILESFFHLTKAYLHIFDSYLYLTTAYQFILQLLISTDLHIFDSYILPRTICIYFTAIYTLTKRILQFPDKEPHLNKQIDFDLFSVHILPQSIYIIIYSYLHLTASWHNFFDSYILPPTFHRIWCWPSHHNIFL